MAAKKDYFGLDYIISLILAIFFGPILGIITRILDGKIVAGILRILPPIMFVCYFADIICLITKKEIWRVLDM